jgi:hypothetical protein
MEEFRIVIVIVAIAVLIAIIITKLLNKNIKRMMQDERLKNAKLFAVFRTPAAISPDGFIGIASIRKKIIIHIKDIKGFRILFDKADDTKIENDTGILLFSNIVSKVEPNFEYATKEIKMQLNMKDNTLVKIYLLVYNLHYEGGKDDDEEVIDYIPVQVKNAIREFLGELESVEKSVKRQSKKSK